MFRTRVVESGVSSFNGRAGKASLCFAFQGTAFDFSWSPVMTSDDQPWPAMSLSRSFGRIERYPQIPRRHSGGWRRVPGITSSGIASKFSSAPHVCHYWGFLHSHFFCEDLLDLGNGVSLLTCLHNEPQYFLSNVKQGDHPGMSNIGRTEKI